MHNLSFEIATSALLLAGFAAFSAGCGSSSANDAAPGGGGFGAAGAGGDTSDQPKIEIAFDATDVIELNPNEHVELTVLATLLKQTTPAPQFPIRFGLSGGDAAVDAVLDATDVQTDAQGIAHVTLIAPSKPTRFDVRASSTSAKQVAARTIVVSASGVTTLRVLPSYTGKRLPMIAKWTATVHAGVSCSAFAGNPPPDGASPASAKPDGALVLRNVPVDVDLAVTLRAGHYVGGCVNVPALSEGEGNQVLVYASDRPLNLDATSLSLSLGASNAHPEFDKRLQANASLAESALLGSAKNDVAALLDGMSSATSPANREAFDVARQASGWDSALEIAFGKNATRRLRDPARRWLSAGLLALNAPDAWVGKLAPLGNAATFTPTAVGTATPNAAGFPGFFPVRWSADSNDTVRLGMELNWEASRLVTALAVAPALAEFPKATSVERALALAVGCAQVGELLLATGASPGSAAFASCDENCATNLCNNSVAAAWGKAQLSSAAIATVSITASGAAQIGDDARATGLSGSWVGELQTDDGTAAVSGALSASSTP